MTLTTTEADLSIGLLCILRPAAVRVLQAMGLDLTLEHERPFEEACAMRDLRVEVVLARIARAERVASTEPQIDWDVLRAHSVFAPPSAIAAR
jgi:hypothetical protein